MSICEITLFVVSLSSTAVVKYEIQVLNSLLKNKAELAKKI